MSERKIANMKIGIVIFGKVQFFASLEIVYFHIFFFLSSN